MTSFATQKFCGPVIGSLVGKDKGDVSNRTKCAGAQFKNTAVGAVETAGVVGVGALGARLGIKNSKIMNGVVKIFDKLANKIKSNPEIREKLLKMPNKAKLFTLVALPVLAATSYISQKTLYKSGQIDQKYTDKATVEKNVKENILD